MAFGKKTPAVSEDPPAAAPEPAAAPAPPAVPSRSELEEAMELQHIRIDALKRQLQAAQQELDGLIAVHNRLGRG